MRNLKRCLIVKFGQIGDVIMAIPAVYALHQRGYDIDWACGQVVLPLLQCYSWIHPIVADDKAILFGRPFDRAASIARLWSGIGNKKYDLCATLYFDARYRLLTLPVRAMRRLAFSRQSRETNMVPGRHYTDEYARVLLGSEDNCLEHSRGPVRPDRLPKSPLPEKTTSKRIALVPGGASKLLRQQASDRLPDQVLRRWPVDRYVEIACGLIDRGWEVVLLGGPDDAWVKPHFQKCAVTDCIGTVSLPEVISVCDACDAVISNDTGPLHLAGLSVACLIGVFGPTDPAMLLPRRPFVTGIWGGEGYACRPCYDGREFAPCRHNGCMCEISPEQVLRELDRLLSARDRGTSSPWRILRGGP
jgi:heptosyltransferase-2